ncbi:MAG: GTPase domain-containing protein [Planctomycetes bacterium]|nr:GTPase domain-containing protein [Planctomycetota bacterium]
MEFRGKTSYESIITGFQGLFEMYRALIESARTATRGLRLEMRKTGRDDSELPAALYALGAMVDADASEYLKRPSQVAVIGAIGSGKSSLIGRFLRGRIPKASESADEPIVIFRHESESRGDSSGAYERTSAKNEEKAPAMREIYLGEPFLRDVNIIDTPGLEEGKLRGEIIARIVPRCDGILYVLPSMKGIRERDEEFISFVAKNHPSIDIQFAINFADVLALRKFEDLEFYHLEVEKALAPVRLAFESKISRILPASPEAAGKPKIWAVSARYGFGVDSLLEHLLARFTGISGAKLRLSRAFEIVKRVHLGLREFAAENSEYVRRGLELVKNFLAESELTLASLSKESSAIVKADLKRKDVDLPSANEIATNLYPDELSNFAEFVLGLKGSEEFGKLVAATLVEFDPLVDIGRRLSGLESLKNELDEARKLEASASDLRGMILRSEDAIAAASEFQNARGDSYVSKLIRIFDTRSKEIETRAGELAELCRRKKAGFDDYVRDFETRFTKYLASSSQPLARDVQSKIDREFHPKLSKLKARLLESGFGETLASDVLVAGLSDPFNPGAFAAPDRSGGADETAREGAKLALSAEKSISILAGKVSAAANALRVDLRAACAAGGIALEEASAKIGKAKSGIRKDDGANRRSIIFCALTALVSIAMFLGGLFADGIAFAGLRSSDLKLILVAAGFTIFSLSLGLSHRISESRRKKLADWILPTLRSSIDALERALKNFHESTAAHSETAVRTIDNLVEDAGREFSAGALSDRTRKIEVMFRNLWGGLIEDTSAKLGGMASYATGTEIERIREFESLLAESVAALGKLEGALAPSGSASRATNSLLANANKFMVNMW